MTRNPLLFDRRRLLMASALISASAGSSYAKQNDEIRFGASRWDAWYNDSVGSHSWAAQRTLDPPRYHHRAPFFSRLEVDGLMQTLGNQTDIDDEIKFAAKAGLKYWAFLKFSSGGSDSAFGRAYNLYQKSEYRSMINWCWIYNFESLKDAKKQGFSDLVAEISQNEYERTGSGQSLFYLMKNGNDQHPEHIAPLILDLRSKLAHHKQIDLYVVSLGSAEDAKILGADAVSKYAAAPASFHGKFSDLARSTEKGWDVLTDSEVNVVPNCTMGWDRRPRIEHPVPWESKTQKPLQGMDNFFEMASPSELRQHLINCTVWLRNHTYNAPAQTALIYSWNEFDEGGWLCPTWTPKGPDNSRLEAIQRVMQSKHSLVKRSI